VFGWRRPLRSLSLARTVFVGAAALTFLSACSAAESPEPVGATATLAETATTTPTAEGTAPATTTAPAPSTTIAVSASEVSLPDGYPISHPPGGDVTDVTEKIEKNSGTDQLVTRVEVWYDGNRFEEFAMFYLNWIVDNGYLIGDSLTNEDEMRVIIRGVMPPENDTYGLTVAVVGDSTLVSTLWARPPG